MRYYKYYDDIQSFHQIQPIAYFEVLPHTNNTATLKIPPVNKKQLNTPKSLKQVQWLSNLIQEKKLSVIKNPEALEWTIGDMKSFQILLNELLNIDTYTSHTAAATAALLHQDVHFSIFRLYEDAPVSYLTKAKHPLGFTIYKEEDKKIYLRISGGGGQADGSAQSSQQVEWIENTIKDLNIKAVSQYGNVVWELQAEEDIKTMIEQIKEHCEYAEDEELIFKP